jgi:hypothetical protein
VGADVGDELRTLGVHATLSGPLGELIGVAGKLVDGARAHQHLPDEVLQVLLHPGPGDGAVAADLVLVGALTVEPAAEGVHGHRSCLPGGGCAAVLEDVLELEGLPQRPLRSTITLPSGALHPRVRRRCTRSVRFTMEACHASYRPALDSRVCTPRPRSRSADAAVVCALVHTRLCDVIRAWTASVMILSRWRRPVPPAVAPAQDALYVLALEEARRAIDQQREDLKSVRDRMVALLGVATVTASVTAATSVGRTAPAATWLRYAVVACIISLMLVTLFVSWPRAIRFTYKPTGIIEWTKANASEAVGRSHLARHLETDYNANRKVINQLLVAFRLGICLLALEIVFLLWSLWG